MVTNAEPNYSLTPIDSDWENFRCIVPRYIWPCRLWSAGPAGIGYRFHSRRQNFLRLGETGTHEAAACGNGLDRRDEVDCRIGLDDIPARAGRECGLGNGF